jgi:hypothetical protein
MWKIGVTAVITAGISFAISTAGGLATWSRSDRSLTIRPGDTAFIEGYNWTCASTVRTPNFQCYPGRGKGPTPTPSPGITIEPRLLQVNSETRVRVSRLSRPGSYLYSFPVTPFK